MTIEKLQKVLNILFDGEFIASFGRNDDGYFIESVKKDGKRIDVELIQEDIEEAISEVERDELKQKKSDEVGESIIKRLGADNKLDAVINQINAQRKALVEIQKALNGQSADPRVVAELNQINDVIEEELSKLQ